MKRYAILAALLVLLSGSAMVDAQERSPDDWLFMVYLDGDNNLERFGVYDLNEMESGLAMNPEANVAVLVLFDGGTGRHIGHEGAKIYLVEPDTSEQVKSRVVADLGEINMGDPATLRDFVDYGVSEYPAYNQPLVLWNHGSGWKALEEERTDVTKDVCFDDTDGDSLTTEELSAIMPDLAYSCDGIELLGFDACLMQMFGIGYEFYEGVGVIAASEETEPGDGWNYEGLIGALALNSGMVPEELGNAIVESYASFYSGWNEITISAINAQSLPYVAEALYEFSMVLTDALGTEREAIVSARETTQSYAYADYIDLYDFAEKVLQASGNDVVRGTAHNLMEAIDGCVISEYSSSDITAHGISIWFDEKYPDAYLLDRYGNLRAVETGWLDFLLAYYA